MLDQAKDAIVADDPAKAEQLANRALATVEGAEGDGQRRVAVGVTIILLTAAVLGFGVMSLRTSRYWGVNGAERTVWVPPITPAADLAGESPDHLSGQSRDSGAA
jgi:hypothetical protein